MVWSSRQCLSVSLVQVYFANPASQTGRVNGVIRRSTDGITFSEQVSVTDGDYAYSCLTQTPDVCASLPSASVLDADEKLGQLHWIALGNKQSRLRWSELSIRVQRLQRIVFCAVVIVIHSLVSV